MNLAIAKISLVSIFVYVDGDRWRVVVAFFFSQLPAGLLFAQRLQAAISVWLGVGY
ncbi:hypothetical protein [uncultured Nostoc sp.]|uniref:hypothetical protein n=1 Tax=uncultured Nostoc sp. TaxID=340711 RepID=UPI0035C9C2B4